MVNAVVIGFPSKKIFSYYAPAITMAGAFSVIPVHLCLTAIISTLFDSNFEKCQFGYSV